jgi:hypothetical protein
MFSKRVVLKVMVRPARLMLAPAGTWLPREVAGPGLPRGPGALAHPFAVLAGPAVAALAESCCRIP